MIKSLNGTKWVCTDNDMEKKGMECEVIDGEINPDFNGDNDIEIRYQDGSVSYIKLRRFMSRFQRLEK